MAANPRYAKYDVVKSLRDKNEKSSPFEKAIGTFFASVGDGPYRVWDSKKHVFLGLEGVEGSIIDVKKVKKIPEGQMDLKAYTKEHVLERQFLAAIFAKRAVGPDKTEFPNSALTYLTEFANDDANLVWVDKSSSDRKTVFFKTGSHSTLSGPDDPLVKFLIGCRFELASLCTSLIAKAQSQLHGEELLFVVTMLGDIAATPWCTGLWIETLGHNTWSQ